MSRNCLIISPNRYETFFFFFVAIFSLIRWWRWQLKQVSMQCWMERQGNNKSTWKFSNFFLWGQQIFFEDFYFYGLIYNKYLEKLFFAQIFSHTKIFFQKSLVLRFLQCCGLAARTALIDYQIKIDEILNDSNILLNFFLNLNSRISAVW